MTTSKQDNVRQHNVIRMKLWIMVNGDPKRSLKCSLGPIPCVFFFAHYRTLSRLSLRDKKQNVQGLASHDSYLTCHSPPIGMHSTPRNFTRTIATIANISPLNQAIEREFNWYPAFPASNYTYSAMADMDIDQDVLSPEAASREVTHTSSSGWNFVPLVPHRRNLNIIMHLNFLCLNHRSCDEHFWNCLYLG